MCARLGAPNMMGRPLPRSTDIGFWWPQWMVGVTGPRQGKEWSYWRALVGAKNGHTDGPTWGQSVRADYGPSLKGCAHLCFEVPVFEKFSWGYTNNQKIEHVALSRKIWKREPFFVEIGSRIYNDEKCQKTVKMKAKRWGKIDKGIRKGKWLPHRCFWEDASEWRVGLEWWKLAIGGDSWP